MANKYLQKILKIALRRDEELEDDPSLDYTDYDYDLSRHPKETAIDFWGYAIKDHALNKRVPKLPEDVRSMFEDIEPKDFKKVKSIIVRNLPTNLMSVEEEASIDKIRQELSGLKLNVEKMPDQNVIPMPSVVVEPNVASYNLNNAFKRIASSRTIRLSMLCGGESYSGNCKSCGAKFSYCKTGTPGEEQDAAEKGYCSVTCENKKKTSGQE